MVTDWAASIQLGLLWVTTGNALIEHMFSGPPPIADVSEPPLTVSSYAHGWEAATPSPAIIRVPKKLFGCTDNRSFARFFAAAHTNLLRPQIRASSTVRTRLKPLEFDSLRKSSSNADSDSTLHRSYGIDSGICNELHCMLA
jgi:hypothetical protein